MDIGISKGGGQKQCSSARLCTITIIYTYIRILEWEEIRDRASDCSDSGLSSGFELLKILCHVCTYLFYCEILEEKNLSPLNSVFPTKVLTYEDGITYGSGTCKMFCSTCFGWLWYPSSFLYFSSLHVATLAHLQTSISL